MTNLLTIDPGKNSGIALGHFDGDTPYTLDERWQVHGGVRGFKRWWREGHWKRADLLVVERFVLASDNEFTADLTPKEIEGALSVFLDDSHLVVVWQLRSDKSRLTGYPKAAVSKSQRQRVRFDFLDRFGLFESGSDNDDSNDAITHALVYLKGIEHVPTLRRYWPPRRPQGLIASGTGLAA